MRSIIFTSAVVALTMAQTTQAQEQGCFARVYSDAHLAAHPNQVVRDMTLWLSGRQSDRSAQIEVKFSGQGHVARDGWGAPVMRQWLSCFDLADGTSTCGVECDGGGFTFAASTADSLTIEVQDLYVGKTPDEADTCGGVINLSEVQGQPVRYRLDRVPASYCAALRDD